MRNSIIMIWVLWVFVGGSIEEDLERPKRVVNGFRMVPAQTHHYKAMEYFTWIGETWSCIEEVSWIVRWGFATPDSPGSHYACLQKPHHQVCGGTLISPRIVQTACHCFTKALIYNEKSTWSGRALDTDLRGKYQIFMGGTDVTYMAFPVASEDVFIHHLCARASVPPNWGRYDVGWLTLATAVSNSKGVENGEWGRKLDFAGPFRRSELEKQFTRVIGSMHVCMVMGFGNTGFEMFSPIEKMTHGYIQYMDIYSCWYWLTESFSPKPPIRELEEFKEKFKDSYDISQSWVCARRIKKFNQHAGAGDSGSPISCNGQYFALVSQSHILEVDFWKENTILGTNSMNVDMAIKYFPEANVVTHRKKFEEDHIVFTTPASANTGRWWTSRADLRRLGQDEVQVIRNPERHLGNSKTHSNSMAERYYNKATRSHTAIQLCFTSVAIVVGTRQQTKQY